jgi:SAM-dependent methyltransferase
MIRGYELPCSEDLKNQINQVAGVRSDSAHFMVKKILWPMFHLKENFMCDGFIEWEVGRRIQKHLEPTTVFLEVGCGDMSLLRYLPSDKWYNAFDMAFSEFHLRRVLAKPKRTNLALASATRIPLEPNAASLIVSTECFEHIPEIDLAIDEIYRVAKPDALLVCSIPNNFGHMYRVKGPHSQHVNNWTFEGFKKFMESHNFSFVEGLMKGVWIPLPLGIWKVSKSSYQLPFRGKSEYYNTNFIYSFRARK